MVGNQESGNLVGVSIAWNQLFKFRSSDWGAWNGTASSDSLSVTWTGTCPSVGYAYLTQYNTGIIVPNHLYYISAYVEATSTAKPTKIWLKADNSATTPTGIDYVQKNYYGFLQKSLSSNYGQTQILGFSGTSGTTYTVKYTQIWISDLTVMFGTEIADYIWSLEQAESRKGVEYFREYVRNDYYPYHANSLESSCPSLKKTTGFNLLDKTATPVIKGSYKCWPMPIGKTKTLWMSFKDKSTTQDVSNTNLGFMGFTTANSGAPGTTYIQYRWCQQAGNIVSTKTNVANGSSVGRLCDNVNMYPTDSTTYNKIFNRWDVCVNVYNEDRNGDYEDYESSSYSIPPVELRGIPTLVDGKIVASGDVRTPGGIVIRKYARYWLKDLIWAKYSTKFYSSTSISTVDAKPGDSVLPHIIVNKKYIATSYQISAKNTSDNMLSVGTPSGRIYVCDSTHDTLESFLENIQDVYMDIELATSSTEYTEPFDGVQNCNPYGIEQFTDYLYEQGERDIEVPVGHETTYYTKL